MRVLVIGNGAREHAITHKFAKSKRIAGLFAFPGNAGTAEIAVNIDKGDITNIETILKICRENRINLVFIGPEVPLAAGISDDIRKEGIPVIGPGKEAAQLESSKVFSKHFMESHKLPTASGNIIKDIDAYKKYIDMVDNKIVIKKNGLAAGKGVLESDSKEELFKFGEEILTRGDSLIAEEYLAGFEVSIFTLCDGKNYIMLPPTADYKKAGDRGIGPNTGGMGAICPVPWLSQLELQKIKDEIIGPTFQGLKEEGLAYTGILYFGLMITSSGPKVLEYNVRLGDPEAQVLLPLIKSDFGNLCEAMAKGKLESFPINILERSALGIVVAAPGYPSSYEKGIPVERLPKLSEHEAFIYHASTYKDESGILRTGGGRCFTVVGIGKDLLQARITAYNAVKGVGFPGSWYRSDIGANVYDDVV